MSQAGLNDKLSLMSSRELMEFIEDNKSSSPDVRDAALMEAKVRGIIFSAPDIEVEKPLILTKVDLDPKDRWGKQQHVEDESAPLLYSKRAIYTFSFFFSVLFGCSASDLSGRKWGRK